MLMRLTLLCAFAMLVVLPGCLLVGTTEVRVRLNDDGSGEAVMRLVDIRSDAESDSAVVHDFQVLMSSLDQREVPDFEAHGRKVTRKQFLVQGDTLIAEVVYTFTSVEAVEGLRVRDDEMYLVVGEGRDLVKTNGKVRTGEKGAIRVVWAKDAKRLMYQIREKSIPPSRSLAPLYLKSRG
jgi:hypothetical protein